MNRYSQNRMKCIQNCCIYLSTLKTSIFEFIEVWNSKIRLPFSIPRVSERRSFGAERTLIVRESYKNKTMPKYFKWIKLRSVRQREHFDFILCQTRFITISERVDIKELPSKVPWAKSVFAFSKRNFSVSFPILRIIWTMISTNIQFSWELLLGSFSYKMFSSTCFKTKCSENKSGHD